MRHWTIKAKGTDREAPVRTRDGTGGGLDYHKPDVLGQFHQHSMRQDAFTLDHVVGDDEQGMTARLQDAPCLHQHRVEIGKEGTQTSAMSPMGEERGWEQIANPGACLKPGVRVKRAGITEPDVALPACEGRRGVAVHPAQRHPVGAWVINGIEIRGRGDDQRLAPIWNERQWLTRVVWVDDSAATSQRIENAGVTIDPMQSAQTRQRSVQ